MIFVTHSKVFSKKYLLFAKKVLPLHRKKQNWGMV